MMDFIKSVEINIGPVGDMIEELFFKPRGFTKEQVIERVKEEDFVEILTHGMMEPGSKKPLWYVVHQVKKELQRLAAVLEGTGRMDETLAEMLGMTLNVEPSFFLYLQEQWDDYINRQVLH